MLLRQHAADVLVIDPVLGVSSRGIASAEEDLIGIAVEHPYLPVVFYASHAAKAVAVIARFPTLEVREALVLGVDDDPQTLRRAMESVLVSSFVGRLMHRLLPATVDVPQPLLRAIRQALSNPGHFRTVDAVATQANMSRRSLDRYFAHNGLVPCAELLQLAKAFLAVRLAKDMVIARHDICAACGLPASESVERFVRRVVGAPSKQFTACSDAELIVHFAARLRREQTLVGS
jgi:AraC-like DNA-binding protein